MMFISHAEQMTFIVEMNFAIWLYQQEPVYRPAIGLECGTSGDHGLSLLGFKLHPVNHFFFSKRLNGGFHRETGGEHFRQDNQIAAMNSVQLYIEMAQVCRAVHPDQRLL
ncbi:hypothetical protein D3C75_634280 [compost metagenome]